MSKCGITPYPILKSCTALWRPVSRDEPPGHRSVLSPEAFHGSSHQMSKQKRAFWFRRTFQRTDDRIGSFECLCGSRLWWLTVRFSLERSAIVRWESSKTWDNIHSNTDSYHWQPLVRHALHPGSPDLKCCLACSITICSIGSRIITKSSCIWTWWTSPSGNPIPTSGNDKITVNQWQTIQAKEGEIFNSATVDHIQSYRSTFVPAYFERFHLQLWMAKLSSPLLLWTIQVA